MKRPTMAETGQFILIVFGVLMIILAARLVLFDGARESLGGGDVAVAIAAAVAYLGGWLRRSPSK